MSRISALLLTLCLGLPGRALRPLSVRENSLLEQQIQSGLEESEQELAARLKDGRQSRSVLEETAAKLAWKGTPEAIRHLHEIAVDPRTKSKIRAAAAIGLGLHGDPNHSLEPLLKALLEEGKKGVSEPAIHTIARALGLLNYRSWRDVEFVHDMIGRVDKEARVHLRKEQMEMTKHGARLEYEALLLGEDPDPALMREIAHNPAISASDAQRMLEGLRLPRWGRGSLMLGYLQFLGMPVSVPAVKASLMDALGQDPNGADPAILQFQVSAVETLSSLVQAAGGLAGKGPAIQRLREDAVVFSREKLQPESLANPILRQAVETYWRPIWNRPEAAGLEEGEDWTDPGGADRRILAQQMEEFVDSARQRYLHFHPQTAAEQMEAFSRGQEGAYFSTYVAAQGFLDEMMKRGLPQIPELVERGRLEQAQGIVFVGRVIAHAVRSRGEDQAGRLSPEQQELFFGIPAGELEDYKGWLAQLKDTLEDWELRLRGLLGSGLEEKSLLKETLEGLRRELPQAGQRTVPLRFVVDTSEGKPEVLRLLQLAVLLNREKGLPIQAAGVATPQELDQALEELPPEARSLMQGLVYLYSPGDPASHRKAMEMARILVPNLIDEEMIRGIDRGRIGLFLEAIERLGVWSFSQEMRLQLDPFLTAA
ncbi:MAG: hypothetical protein HYZ93_07060 [Candidatus Omnitrophica bacterium]|nr:hypothetical protein [Candidatus Omnitrophota bacterium]